MQKRRILLHLSSFPGDTGDCRIAVLGTAKLSFEPVKIKHDRDRDKDAFRNNLVSVQQNNDPAFNFSIHFSCSLLLATYENSQCFRKGRTKSLS